MTEFPPGFFDRGDESVDSDFYSFDRLVTHIDAGATAAVSELYRELELTGEVLDLCSSWVSHFDVTPSRLVALGMNGNELAANAAATDTIVHDLNADPMLPFDDTMFDAVTCCVSVDYLVRPVEVFSRSGACLAPRRRLRGHVLESLFSEQGHPHVARGGRSPTLLDRRHLLRHGRRIRDTDRATSESRSSG